MQISSPKLKSDVNTYTATPTAILHTLSGSHSLHIQVADSFLRRFKGLMLTPRLAHDTGMLILGCSSVHTAFMRYAIDVIYLDTTGKVLKCVPHLRAWRGSISNIGRDKQGKQYVKAAHTLELAAGSIERLGICSGDYMIHAYFRQVVATQIPHCSVEAVGPDGVEGLHLGQTAPMAVGTLTARRRQRGATMVEFVVVGPILTVIGLSLIQYGMLFFAKNQINHGSFMAARAGSFEHASLSKVQDAYAIALVPLYGGGQNVEDIAKALVKVKADMILNSQIEILNPTKESFDDFNDPKLQTLLETGSKRVISNRNLGTDNQTVGPKSGQTREDANLIKLRITHGYTPVVPIIGSIYKAYLKWLDPGTDAFHTRLVNAGRIPIVSHVTVQMQSDAIEPDTTVSSPGNGNAGNPTNPTPPTGPGSKPVITTPPPYCPNGGCSSAPGGMCTAALKALLSADALFDFDKSDLQAEGIKQLDAIIAKAKAQNIDFETLNVTGYSDPIGGDSQHNLDLSKARAKTVSDYLTQNGIKVDTVNIVGKGATDFVKPLSECSNMSDTAQKACLAPNRRVTVELIAKK